MTTDLMWSRPLVVAGELRPVGTNKPWSEDFRPVRLPNYGLEPPNHRDLQRGP